jgi:hypothetical protein
MRRTHKKKLRRVLLITLAILFLVESWLWDTMGAAIARVIRAIPFERIKHFIASRIEHLSPMLTLGVFIIPVMVLLPFKFFALWLLAKGFVLSGILSILGAKLVGLGVTSFLFVLCKPKLLQLRGVNWRYYKCLHWREVAHRLVSPYTRYIRRYIRALKPSGPMGKLLWKLRARMHKVREVNRE